MNEALRNFSAAMKRLNDEDKNCVAEKLHKRNLGISKGYLKPTNHR